MFSVIFQILCADMNIARIQKKRAVCVNHVSLKLTRLAEFSEEEDRDL